MKSDPVEKKARRPVLYPNARRVNAWLTPEHLKIAKELGVGNISTGIRVALERAGKKKVTT